MKTTLLSVLALGTCASVAFAESLPPAGKADGSTAARSHPAGPVALSEAEMDNVAAGAVTGGYGFVLPSSGDETYIPRYSFKNAWPSK